MSHKIDHLDEDNLLLEDLRDLSNKLQMSYKFGKGTADAFKLCGVNRLCDIVDQCEEISLKIDSSSLGISERQKSMCKQCLIVLNENSKNDILRLIKKSRITGQF